MCLVHWSDLISWLWIDNLLHIVHLMAVAVVFKLSLVLQPLQCQVVWNSTEYFILVVMLATTVCIYIFLTLLCICITIGIAVDWMANNIYWADGAYDWIMLTNYNGSLFKALIDTQVDKPRGITVHPQQG